MMPVIKSGRKDFPRGHAYLGVEMVSGQSAVTSTWAASPIKILVPQSRGTSAWAFTSSFGGGLVAGDQTQLEIKVGKGASCFVGTQASTKIYRNPSRHPCSHVTRALLAPGSLLVFAPDPVQAFTDSTYAQQQSFHLDADAGLVLVDWFTSGRAARGERWKFACLRSRNDVFVDGERVFLDSIRLDAASGFMASEHQTGRFNCFATLLLLGTPMKEGSEKLLQDIAARPVGRRGALVASASAVSGGALLRIAGASVEEVGRELHQQLKFITSFLGDDPWLRKW